jgi:hypothetical protein
MNVALMSFFKFFAIGGTNVVFLAIGRTNVDLIEGGTNVVVAVALMSSGTYDGGKKVAASFLCTKTCS